VTYNELRRSVTTWTSNTDPEYLSQINTFIFQAEARIGQLVKLPNYEATASLATVAGVNTISLASLTPQFQAIDYLWFADYGTLEFKEKSFIVEAFPNNSEQGIPRYVGLQDDLTLIIGPTPDNVYNLTLYYYGKWPSLVTLGTNPSTVNNETYISRSFEAALLNGVLMNSALFMQDTECYQRHKQEFMENLGLIKEYKSGPAYKPYNEKSNAANDGQTATK
jgi:hypothetical protein